MSKPNLDHLYRTAERLLATLERLETKQSCAHIGGLVCGECEAVDIAAALNYVAWLKEGIDQL